MSFAWPWLLLALPLPWLLRRLPDHSPALRLPGLPEVLPVRARSTSWLAVLAWLLLVTAAAGPQIVDESETRALSGRDLMLAFDVSDSMGLRDLQLDRRPVTRLQAARAMADEFLRRRAGDRVGLIVFGSKAYLHTPPSFDLEAVRAALADADTGLAGRETALGDAVALAVAHLKTLPAGVRVLVLLSDGANTAGSLTPERAAWLARREQVRVHALAIGPDGDGGALKRISEDTGGLYVHASDSAALAAFFRQLDAIEPSAGGRAPLHRIRALYAWPLALSLSLLCWLLLRRKLTS
jgi:Ca-activated chloride channel family protein